MACSKLRLGDGFELMGQEGELIIVLPLLEFCRVGVPISAAAIQPGSSDFPPVYAEE